MAYGIKIIDAYGNSFVDTYTPFAVIDILTTSGNGSKVYSIGTNESIAIVETTVYPALAACYAIYVSGGTVTWTYYSSPSAAPAGAKAFSLPGAIIHVLRKAV